MVAVNTGREVSARRSPAGEEADMLKNTNYNLLEEIVQKSQSLYRYDRYIKDAEAEQCQGCREPWHRMKDRDGEDLGQLMQHFKAHIDAGRAEFGPQIMRAA
jgi:hypothetical protein